VDDDDEDYDYYEKEEFVTVNSDENGEFVYIDAKSPPRVSGGSSPVGIIEATPVPVVTCEADGDLVHNQATEDSGEGLNDKQDSPTADPVIEHVERIASSTPVTPGMPAHL